MKKIQFSLGKINTVYTESKNARTPIATSLSDEKDYIVRPVTHQEIQIQEQDLLKVLLFQYPELRENIDEAASLPILEK